MAHRTARLVVLAAALVAVIALCGCATATPIPTVEVVCGCAMDVTGGEAYFDANGNGVLDSSDPPLSGVVFVLRYNDGTEIRRTTGADGRVSVGVCYPPEAQIPPGCPGWPVETMEAPPGYELIRRVEAKSLFGKVGQ